MAKKNFKISDPITITRIGSGAAGTSGTRRSLLTAPRPRGYYPRRSQTSLINFFDCGQISNGAGGWTDAEANVDPGYGISIVNVATNPTPVFTFNNFELSHWSDFLDYFLAVPVDEWADTYRPIQYSESELYGLSVYNGRGVLSGSENWLDGSNPDWSADGLDPQGNDLEITSKRGITQGFSTTSSNYKITAINDYSSPAVAMDLSQGANVFLLPYASAVYAGQDTGQDATFTTAVLISFWCVKNRSVLLPKGFYNDDTLGIPPAWQDPAHSTRIKASVYFDLVEAMKAACPLSIVYKKVGTAASVGAGGIVNQLDPVSSYPYPSTTTPYWVNGGVVITDSLRVSFGAFGGTTAQRDHSPGILRAVITAGSATYYIWLNASVAGGTDSENPLNKWPLSEP
jgi:hypothetical protein